jgi:hypothetical protein
VTRLALIAFAMLAGCEPCIEGRQVHEKLCEQGYEDSCEFVMQCAPGTCGTPGAPPCP